MLEITLAIVAVINLYRLFLRQYSCNFSNNKTFISLLNIKVSDGCVLIWQIKKGIRMIVGIILSHRAQSRYSSGCVLFFGWKMD